MQSMLPYGQQGQWWLNAAVCSSGTEAMPMQSIVTTAGNVCHLFLKIISMHYYRM
jgi:hypothetical protein